MSLDYETFDLGDLVLQSGATLRDCKLAYKTFGTLSPAKDNVIVYPTWYSGQHYDNEWLIGEGMALDPTRYFIIIPNMLGNGLSSSPSNNPEPYNGRGVSYLAVNDIDAAMDDFNQALALNRNYAEAWSNRGLALEAKGERNKARAAFSRALTIEPGMQSAKDGIRRLDTGKPPIIAG